ncbi:MAG: hypothetical protein P8N09_07010 [Planctomycetota bacterium]|nr:hypothetical protein [Planctomycetota bacterium]
MTRLKVGFLLAALAFAPYSTSLHAQQSSEDDSTARIAELEAQVDKLGSDYQQLLEILKNLEADAALRRDTLPEDEFYIPRGGAGYGPSGGGPGTMVDAYSFGVGDLRRLAEKTYIGGYIDIEYANPTGSGTASREFDQHRFVPFIYSDINESIKVAAEIEVEHGHELEVEFAQMDFLINQYANLRAGIQLLPLGKFNMVHDSPLQELTYRPMVDTYIIPTTLRDAGLGMWGDVTETISYHATVTNGFRGLTTSGTNEITREKGLRNAAPYKNKIGKPFENFNNAFAYTGRLQWTPILGLETGISGLLNKYDEKADNNLKIWALDATLQGQAVPGMPDNMELLYEGAWADIQRNRFAHNSGVAGDMNGHYVQANVHFVPNFIADSIGDNGFVEDGAHFTFVTRYGMVDLDDYVRRRTTLGLNYRPNESDTVIKFDYLFNGDNGPLSGDNDDNIWAMSFASYF